MSALLPPPDAPPESFRSLALRFRSILVDRVTGLPSVPLLVDDLRGLLETRRQLGVLHVEIVALDLVESLYGWQVFDRVLVEAARILADAVGPVLPAGTLLAIDGTGSDRFVLFLPDPESGEPGYGSKLERTEQALARRLDAALDADEFAGLSPRLRFRTGHALLSESPYYRFERRVHAAIEEARTLESRRDSGREISWEADLRRIIEDAGIETLFQPVVDLETGTVLGFEALSRGPKDSIFELPSAMFTLGRRFGLGAALDRVCRGKAIGARNGLETDGKLFLNVLPASLADPAWREGEVAALLEDASLKKEDLVVEVSERAVDADPVAFSAGCRQIRSEGFSLALDDVGTGYATLGTLEAVRPDFLKMDASLVHGIHENLIKQDLLFSLVQIGRRMGAEVIAEGVETADETAVLRAAGTRYGQGFHFARPAARAPRARRTRPESDGA